ncbi:MAG: VgrG-related protein [Leptolyngbyaceae cyanobacterium]
MNTAYRALPDITIDGTKADSEILDNILQVVVEESLHRPSLFTIVVRNDYKPGSMDDSPWKVQKKLQIGQSVEIGFDPSTTFSTDELKSQKGSLCQGEITCIETQFSESTQAPIVFRGYDRSHRLHRGRFNRSFQNITDSDVVQKIAEEVDIPTDTIDESSEPHDYLFQENQTNMEFLRSRAARVGFELFVRDGKLNFRKPNAQETIALKWLENLRSFRVRMTSTEQVKEVEVRGWDYTTKKPIISNATSEEVLTQNETSQAQKGSEVSTAFEKMQTPPKMVIVDQPMFKLKEADTMAQALCDELGGQYIVADAKAEGNPQIRPGIFVELQDLGPYSGKYYVTETRHTYSERLYTTEFCVRGLRSGDLVTTLAPPTQLRPGQTLLVGIVTDNTDPEDMGRVKVKFPTLTEEHTSNWARVVSMGAANSRGFDCLPEIDDEVLVAFEHGDIHRPYILGGVWNGQDTPPNSAANNVQDGKVRLRTIQTRTGHKLQFVEEDKGEKAGVYVHTTGGHKIKLNDSQQFVEIETSGRNVVKLDDTGKSIQIQTSAGQTVLLSDPSSISIASNGTLSLSAPAGISNTTGGGVSHTASSINTTASGAMTWNAGSAFTATAGSAVTVTAPIILLNGLVKINGMIPVLVPPPV